MLGGMCREMVGRLLNVSADLPNFFFLEHFRSKTVFQESLPASPGKQRWSLPVHVSILLPTSPMPATHGSFHSLYQPTEVSGGGIEGMQGIVGLT